MLFTKLSWGMAALAVSCQLVVTVVIVAMFTLHPALASSFSFHEDGGAPVAVTYDSEKEMHATDWEVSDLLQC